LIFTVGAQKRKFLDCSQLNFTQWASEPNVQRSPHGIDGDSPAPSKSSSCNLW